VTARRFWDCVIGRGPWSGRGQEQRRRACSAAAQRADRVGAVRMTGRLLRQPRDVQWCAVPCCSVQCSALRRSAAVRCSGVRRRMLVGGSAQCGAGSERAGGLANFRTELGWVGGPCGRGGRAWRGAGPRPDAAALATAALWLRTALSDDRDG
jgi:hypothetical protein